MPMAENRYLKSIRFARAMALVSASLPIPVTVVAAVTAGMTVAACAKEEHDIGFYGNGFPQQPADASVDASQDADASGDADDAGSHDGGDGDAEP